MPSPIWSWLLPAWSAGSGKASWLWLFRYFVVLTDRRTLSVSDQPFAGDQDCANGAAIDDDGSVALDQLRRRVSRRLPRHLLVEHGKRHFFLMLALISAMAGIAIMLLRRPLRSVLA